MKWRDFDAAADEWDLVPRQPPRVATGADFDVDVLDEAGVDLDDHR